MGLKSGLQDKSISAARRKKIIIIMETHATPRDEPPTPKLHTHCRYRHRHSRPGERLGPSSLPRYGSGRGSPSPQGLWGHRGSRSWDRGRWVPTYLMPPQDKGTGMMDALSSEVGCWDARHPTQGTLSPQKPHAGDAGTPGTPERHTGPSNTRRRDPRTPTQGH